MKTINTNNSISTLFLIFFISTLIFPTLIINKLIFILIIGISILNIKTERVITIAPIIIFFIFLFGYINSFSNNVDKDLSLQFFLSVTVLFLIYPIKKYYIDLDRIIKISGLLMSVYTLVFALMIVIYKNDSLLNIFSTYNSGGYGMRDFSNEGLLSFHQE